MVDLYLFYYYSPYGKSGRICTCSTDRRIVVFDPRGSVSLGSTLVSLDAISRLTDCVKWKSFLPEPVLDVPHARATLFPLPTGQYGVLLPLRNQSTLEPCYIFSVQSCFQGSRYFQIEVLCCSSQPALKKRCIYILSRDVRFLRSLNRKSSFWWKIQLRGSVWRQPLWRVFSEAKLRN